MEVGKFGSQQFVVSSSTILPIGDITISAGTGTSTESAAQGKKGATKVSGPSLRKVRLTLQLNASLGVEVRTAIDSWMQLAEAGTPNPLIICGQAVSANKFLLKSCSASDITIVRSKGAAKMAIAKMSLEFEEYLPPGAQTAASGKKTGSSIAVNNAYDMPTSEEKGDMKRVNPGMGG